MAVARKSLIESTSAISMNLANIIWPDDSGDAGDVGTRAATASSLLLDTGFVFVAGLPFAAVGVRFGCFDDFFPILIVILLFLYTRIQFLLPNPNFRCQLFLYVYAFILYLYSYA